MPRKIRQLISDLEKHGFMNKGGRGSYRNFVHIKYSYVVVISGQSGADGFVKYFV